MINPSMFEITFGFSWLSGEVGWMLIMSSRVSNYFARSMKIPIDFLGPSLALRRSTTVKFHFNLKPLGRPAATRGA